MKRKNQPGASGGRESQQKKKKKKREKRTQVLPQKRVVGKKSDKNYKKKRKKQQKSGVHEGNVNNAGSDRSNWEQLRTKLSQRPKKISLMPDHVRKGKKRKRNAVNSEASPSLEEQPASNGVANTSGQMNPALYISCDAEMVGVGASDTSALARVSLTDWYGRVLYDKFVKPRGRVTNYRTWVSGIRKRDLQHAMPFSRAKSDVAALLKGKILVGHAVHNDLKCLEIEHPDTMIRDTAQYPPLMRRNQATGKLQPRKLKDLSEQIGYAIQSGSHSSVEDAQATMRVYRHYKKDWDSWLDSGGKFVPATVPDVKSGGSQGGGTGRARNKKRRNREDPFASKHKRRRMS